MHRRQILAGAGAAIVGPELLPFLKSSAAWAAAPTDTLVVAVGTTLNSLDLHRVGTNRPSYQVTVNCYDRLLTFDTKTMPDGAIVYDYGKVKGELAESWEIAADGLSATFKLKSNTTFWDGTPVTAADVKWSFDRAVSLGGFPTVQMKAGGLEKPEQFQVVDDKSFRARSCASRSSPSPI